MENTQKIFDAQALSDWVDPANWLTPTEAHVEAAYHRLLINITRPAPSQMMLAFVAVLELASAHGRARIGKC